MYSHTYTRLIPLSSKYFTGQQSLNFIFQKKITSPVPTQSGGVFFVCEKSRKVDSRHRACVSLPVPRFSERAFAEQIPDDD